MNERYNPTIPPRMKTALLTVAYNCLLGLSQGRPDGAPLSACESMTPQHYGFPESTDSHTYEISVGGATHYTPGEKITGNVASSYYSLQDI